MPTRTSTRRAVSLAVAATLLVVACSRGDGPGSAAGTTSRGSVAGSVPAGSTPGSAVPPGPGAPLAPEADPDVSRAAPEPLVLPDGTTIAPGQPGAVTTTVATGTSATSAAVSTTRAPSTTTTATSGPVPSPKIQSIVDTYRARHGVTGVSVAVVQVGSGGAPIITPYVSGVPTTGSSTPVLASTLFEMGSETKTFTAALLAQLVAAGRVSLSDPVQKYVPEGVTVPTWSDGTAITIGNLATHQAGLPDEPANLDAGNPSARPGYTASMLWQELPKTTLLWKPGTNWLYSNYGWGLLGTVLADLVAPGQALPPFGSVVGQVLTGPAAMGATVLEDCNTDTCPQMPALVTPYAAGNVATNYWNNNNALAGGGGLVSNIDDMGTWIAAALGSVPAIASFATVPLRPVSTITTVCKKPKQCGPASGGFRMGLAWQLYDHATWLTEPYAFKNGGTAGMHSTTYVIPGRGLGVTVLSNSPVPLDDLGKYIVHAIVTGAAG